MDKINVWDWAKQSLLTFGFVDDFDGYVTGDRWTAVVDGGAAVAQDADDLRGVINMTTGATNNNEAYIATRETLKFADGAGFLVYARLQYAEAATNIANIIFGVGEGFGAADTLIDNGGGPLADYDGACWFKVDGGTRWQFETSNGTSQTTTDTEKTAGGSGFATLAIEVQCSATEVIASPWFDSTGRNALDTVYRNGALPREAKVQHRFTYSGAGEMAVCFGVKAGAATNETLKVDLCILQANR